MQQHLVEYIGSFFKVLSALVRTRRGPGTVPTRNLHIGGGYAKLNCRIM